jgi:hypothetical protein
MIRHKLNIKYPVDEKYIETAYLLKEINGKEIDLYERQEDYHWVKVGHKNFTVPFDWVEQIPEEGPVSFHEWLDGTFELDYESGGIPSKITFNDEDMEMCWAASQENERKRTQLLVDAVKGALRIKGLWQPPADPIKIPVHTAVEYRALQSMLDSFEEALKTLEDHEV